MNQKSLSDQAKKLKHFLLGQYFADGLRITFGVLLPSLILYYFNKTEIGIIVSLGALCVSIVDGPGPILHKRNGMLLANLFIFITAILTGLANRDIWLLAVEIVVLCFFFSMLSAYGQRASSVGTAALLVMVLTMDRLTNNEMLMHASYLLIGGVWYMLLSLSVYQFVPYRLAQQTLGECINEVAKYLRLRARFYDIHVSIDNNFKSLADQQAIVHQQQENVREILYKTRKVVKEDTKAGQLLILIFSDILDIFEQAMATHYDYAVIRVQYPNILSHYKSIIEKLADELDNIGSSLNNNEKPRPLYALSTELEKIKASVDSLESEEPSVNVLVLRKILLNIRDIIIRIEKIFSYYDQKVSLPDSYKESLSKFVSHQKLEPEVFKNNISFESVIFRHSLRVAAVCLTGFLITKLLNIGHHSYWILLTILVILKPAFSLTKQRNYERIIGTVIGAIIGIIILTYIKDTTVRFVFLLFFMLLTYTFQRIKYVISVLFMTPFILILFSFIENQNSLSIAQERIADTFIGSFIALIASYFILPNWEASQLKKYMVDVLVANVNYLKKILISIEQGNLSQVEYKLARKNVYVSTANMTLALQRMSSEPKRKQHQTNLVNKFITLNHALSSYIATLIFSFENNNPTVITPTEIKLIRKIFFTIKDAIENLEGKPPEDIAEIKLPEQQAVIGSNTISIGEQLNFIHKTALDIKKITVDLKTEPFI